MPQVSSARHLAVTRLQYRNIRIPVHRDHPRQGSKQMAAVLNQLDDLEIGLCLKVNRLGNIRVIRRFFSVISRLGDGGFWVALGIGLVMYRGSGILPDLARITATSLVGIVIYKSLKGHLLRERPYITHHGIRLGEKPLDRYSFPSGHTLHAAGLATMLVHLEPSLHVIAVPFAVLVALSRIVLGLHYPSDVLVGAAIGILLAAASIACS